MEAEQKTWATFDRIMLEEENDIKLNKKNSIKITRTLYEISIFIDVSSSNIFLHKNES